jgi:hypothetical protein
MKDQLAVFEDMLAQHQQEAEQRDDITMIGVQV